MRLNVNHVAEIYTSLNSTSERASKKRTRIRPMFCDVTGNIFHGFNMAGCAEAQTYRQTNDDSETDSDDTAIVRAVLERGEAAESDDYSRFVQPYRFEPYLAMPNGVDSAIAADGECGEHVTCWQTNDDSDTSVHDKYIAAAILERQENDEFDDAYHIR